MVKEYSRPTDHFDPEQWSSIYSDDNRDGSAFIFRRGVELVFEICSGLCGEGEVWLDIGCGTGDLAAKLSRTGLIIKGIDQDPAMIELAQKRFLSKCEANNLTFLTASAYELPFGDETIDGIMATSLAGCLEFPDRFYREIYRVLRKNGFMVLTFTNRTSILLKINRFIHGERFKSGKTLDDAFLFRLYSSKSVTGNLEKIGFRVAKVEFYNFFLSLGSQLIPPKSVALYLERLKIFQISRRLGRNFIIVAQKIY